MGKFGGNYRDDLLHGYVDEVLPIQSAVVLIATLHLILLEVVQDSETNDAAKKEDNDVTS